MQILKGKVLHGKKRGKKLSFPTANIKPNKTIPPGIYVSAIRYRKANYPAVTFIGNATTFNEKEVLAETHIFNFSKNIYNHWIKIRLIKKLRDNKKFANSKSLAAQIKKDVEIARNYFNNV